jgi:hypothetical protein
MKVLILADEIFAMRERAMLSRLELGLADEGVRVIHGVPAELIGMEQGSMFSRVVGFESSRIGAFRRMLARRLAGEIRDPDAEEDDQPVSIVHVFGGSVWDLAVEVATELKSELVLELWRPALRERAEEMLMTWKGVSAPVFTVPDPALEKQVRELSPKLTVRSTPWGVHAEETTHRLLPKDRVPTAVIIGGGHDREACTAALTGIAQAIPHHRDLMVFIDSRVVRRGDLWPVCKRLGLLPSISLIEDIEARRDLLTQADLLIVPEARGENHSVVLEAMAAPMAVVALADPAVGSLIDGKSARLVKRIDSNEWASVIREMLGDPEGTNRLAQSAREFVRAERGAFKQIKAVLELYQWMTSKAAIPIR